MSYVHNTITINGQEVSVEHIVQNQFLPDTENSDSAAQFIIDWLNNKETFTLTTSGSTGIPKSITLHRYQLEASAQRTITALKLTDKHVANVCLSTKFIAGKMMLVRALLANMKIEIIEPSVNPFSSFIHPIDFLAIVPAQLHSLNDHPEYYQRLENTHAVIIGGAAVNSYHQSIIDTMPCPVYATYGMTETVSHIALRKMNGNDASLYFQTLPGISITLDERECLVIKLPENPEPIVTNDVGVLHNHNTFSILGRYDHVINTGGNKVYPEHIEEQLSKLFSILNITQNFFIGSQPDDQWGELITLYIEGEPLPQSIREQLLDNARQNLKTYEVPRAILYKPSFIRTATGKINRKASQNQ